MNLKLSRSRDTDTKEFPLVSNGIDASQVFGFRSSLWGSRGSIERIDGAIEDSCEEPEGLTWTDWISKSLFEEEGEGEGNFLLLLSRFHCEDSNLGFSFHLSSHTSFTSVPFNNFEAIRCLAEDEIVYRVRENSFSRWTKTVMKNESTRWECKWSSNGFQNSYFFFFFPRPLHKKMISMRKPMKMSERMLGNEQAGELTRLPP